MRSLKGWALAPTSTGATKTGARGRRGLFAGAAVTALLAATLVPVLAAPASAEVGGNGVGAVDPVTGFPSYISDGTTKLALCADGLANGCVGDLVAEGEAFYFHAAAAGGNLEAFEAGLEVLDDGIDPPAAFSVLRFRMTGLQAGAIYTIQHPYGVNSFIATAEARSINEVIDAGGGTFAGAAAGFLGNYAAHRPTFLRQSNPAPGFIGDINVPGTVTGAPSGLNAVIVTGPHAGGVGINTLRVDQFTVQGRIDNTATAPVAPNRPISMLATAANGSVRANWTVPGNGGSALQIYHVRVVDAQTGLKIFKLQDIPAPAGFAPVSLNMTGLPNGIPFRVQVQAKNVVGMGPVSNHSNTVIPKTVPTRPTIRLATAGVGSVTGNWAAASNGGAAIQRYHVRVVDAATGRKVFVLRDVLGSARNLTAAMPRGIAVRFQVQAINAVGGSLNSAHSNSVAAR